MMLRAISGVRYIAKEKEYSSVHNGFSSEKRVHHSDLVFHTKSGKKKKHISLFQC